MTHAAPAAASTPQAFSDQLTAALGDANALDDLLPLAPQDWIPEHASIWLLRAALDAHPLMLAELAGPLSSGELSSVQLTGIKLRLRSPHPYVALSLTALTPSHRVERRAVRDRRFGEALRDAVHSRFGSAVTFTLDIDLEAGAPHVTGMGHFGAERLLDLCTHLLNGSQNRATFTDDLRGHALNAQRMMDKYPHASDVHFRTFMDHFGELLDAHEHLNATVLARVLTAALESLIDTCPADLI
ncbi:hypothetical protein [Deinococcus soli (ex Cha et al. 2016)]|uniref:Uncharacterized protein n=2 Tax=Deinococcus soli (ex Cha et al. 2016) TaxID=1309411 RepID=A0AAE4BMW7_9DEIO|nr:hypothetical protein [Deinococcus soli (ex Cha et al. 2016)]MDR6218902.1 hypothetical protein [Deinococcus soli (ex Cha et al. 2016)]MDR6328699.1 hypothetical protein [Deinococcus soli (ex Cha et al. 2016)]MDR6751814.1 hypothetical protein [Deinococcus soli (ex Cha et al. 2016)]